ncbi:PREDICTED: uncharacterized protein LOC108378253 [Rhagoletis zephyria]|uniref:uncharacterized protein LOC108378253 n=1 Tax=Rhagoletis zephyria TaxID=28612 RepID=UPI00081133EB|nr:PREDICTED: uncharacterized protein LOC108378253 [Rhagoletis zephyria]
MMEPFNFNYKGYRFLYINGGSPGKCNDSFIYERSLLKQELHNCALLNKMSIQLESVNIPVLILGDSAFRLSPNLMKPFPFSLNNTSAQKNSTINCLNVAGFRRVGKGIDNNIQNANAVIKACCTLHNFLIEEKDDMPTIWLSEQTNMGRNTNYPNHSTNLMHNRHEAEDIINALSIHFAIFSLTAKFSWTACLKSLPNSPYIVSGEGGASSVEDRGEADASSSVHDEDDGSGTLNGADSFVSCELPET